MSDAQIKAMEAIFALCEAIEDNDLTINNLTEIVAKAVAEGHDKIEICLSMTGIAVERARKLIPTTEQDQ